MDQQVQPRPQHQRLPRDHPDPADEGHADGEFVREDVQEHQHVSERKWDDAQRCDEEGGEVAAAVAFEGEEAEDDQFQGVVPG